MRVTEIYASVQGETQYAGLPCTLVRTTGCDLRCTYCDTAYSFYGGREMSLDDILAVFGLSGQDMGGDLVLATFLFMQRMSNATQVTQVTETLVDQDETETRDISKLEVPPGVEVFEIYGSLFFGAIERFKDAMRSVKERPRVLILRMRHVQTIDASGLHTMSELLEATQRRSIALIISAANADVRELMERVGFSEALGAENFCEDIFCALDRARAVLAAKNPK